ncbi:MAG: mechanosensitive ion channel [Planctomycetes bacterium]|nr:mechanosensitive ion channel [Planctomycetota bacterium]
MVRPPFRLVLWLLWLLAGLLPAQATGQDPAAEVSVAALQTRIAALQADTSLAPEVRTPVLEVLGRALEWARTAETQKQLIARYAEQRASAGDRLAQRRRELQALDERRPGPPRPDLDLAALEQGLAAARQTQAEAQRQASEVEAERARRAERRAAIPTLAADYKARLDALPQQPAEAAGADPRLSSARKLALLAERTRLQAEVDGLAAELQTYDAEAELLRAERELAARRAAAASADAEAWLVVLQPMRGAAAQRAELEARLAVQRADPRLEAIAAQNAQLAATAAQLAERRRVVEADKSSRAQERQRLQQDFDETRKRAELVGPTDAIGALLRQRRVQLVETSRRHLQRTRSRDDRIADAQLQSIEFDERRRRLVEDPEAWLVRELGGETAVAALPPELLAEARRLRDGRRDLLQQLADGYTALLGDELDAQGTERQITDLIATYRAYVTERVLGIRSSRPLWQLDWRVAASGVAWLLDPHEWAEVGHLLVAAVVAPVWPLLPTALLVALLCLRRLLGRRLARHGERAARGSNVAYTPTALAAVDTVLLALPIPGLCWLGGFLLAAHPRATEFAKALAAGAEHTSWTLFLVLAIAALVRPRGLAEAHFQWQSTTVAHLRRAVRPLLLAVLPFTTLLAMFEAPGDDRWIGTLGSLLLLGQLLLLLVAFSRLLHPRTGILGASVRQKTTLQRFQRLWFLLGAGTPAVLLVMAVLGYDFTVLQLARRLLVTFAVLVVAVFVHAMVVRGLVLERRRLQIRRAQERLQAAKAADEGSAPAELAAAEPVDPQSLARQTQTLLRGVVTIATAIVVYQVWVDVLPALGALRGVVLWGDGSAADPAIVTLADLLWSLFLLLAALAAARNLPALLELFVLQRLEMQPGERHALSTLVRYGIVILGVVWSFSSIGIGWAKVQWLVAAVSVGLGFGLQEIFANFVSGLILLFEQPVRVGDIVQVGTTTGRVTRIRIRATTIQDWDRKELVIPNRDFVTKEVTNWTLSDPVVRWVFPVGVAYGSDTEQALQLLEQCARQSRFVVAEPRPEAVFVGFGDSALNLQLRAFVDMNRLEYRWMTDLYQSIDAAFRKAGIQIAFPQRDVNLRLSDQVLALLRQNLERR